MGGYDTIEQRNEILEKKTGAQKKMAARTCRAREYSFTCNHSPHCTHTEARGGKGEEEHTYHDVYVGAQECEWRNKSTGA